MAHTEIHSKRLGQAVASDVFTLVYQAPAGTRAIVRNVRACHAALTSDTVLFTCCLVPSGDEPGPENALAWEVGVPFRGLADDDGVHVLEAGDRLMAKASQADVIAVTASGAEEHEK